MAEQIAEQTTTTTTKLMTVDEWMAAYNERAFELVEGEIVEMSPPEVQHGYVAHDLCDALAHHVRERQLGRVWIEVPYLLDASNRTDWVRGSRVPDVSFIAQDRMDAHIARYGKKGPWRLAPDLAVEIVSPNDDLDDVQAKVAEYLHYGVQLVWVIDPQARSIRVHTPDSPDGHTLHDDDILSGAPVLPDWSLPVTDVFGEAE